MTNKSQIGGILSIISGVLGILWGFIMFLFIPLLNTAFWFDYQSYDTETMAFLTAFFVFLGIVGVLLGALGIAGGVFSLRRRLWGLALAGAIAGIITFWPTGIAAIILVSLGRDEFAPPTAPAAGTLQPPLTPPSPPFSQYLNDGSLYKTVPVTLS